MNGTLIAILLFAGPQEPTKPPPARPSSGIHRPARVAAGAADRRKADRARLRARNARSLAALDARIASFAPPADLDPGDSTSTSTPGTTAGADVASSAASIPIEYMALFHKAQNSIAASAAATAASAMT